MRRKEKEITDLKELDEILKQASILRIAMASGGEPYLVPVNFLYYDKTIFFHSAIEGKKISILRSNPRICFETTVDEGIIISDRPCGCTMKFRSVIGTGYARFIDEPDEKRKILEAVTGKYAPAAGRNVTDAEARSVAVLAIDIDNLTGKKSGM